VTSGQLDALPASARRRLMIKALLRPALTATGLFLLYYLLPLEDRLTGTTGASLLLGLVAFAALLAWQVRGILKADHPRLRAVEALAVSLPLFLVVFAAVYFTTGRNDPASFSEGLNRTDALYFAVTVFASVGFGDITPVAQGARVMVMIQMVADLVVVGIVARVILGAVQAGLRRHEAETPPV
jgi:voltage-gated potassium channel